jgi:hypothetical protein
VKILAVMKNQNIIKQIVEFKLSEEIKKGKVFMKLKMINLGVI